VPAGHAWEVAVLRLGLFGDAERRCWPIGLLGHHGEEADFEER
jgi:hypothetical protein